MASSFSFWKVPIRVANRSQFGRYASFSGQPVVTPRKRVLSGVQPTGCLHLGNYLGAIKQWVDNQDLYDSYFCVVDLHAITMPYDPQKLENETLQAAAMYLACGIDPHKSKIFIQSHVRAHTELTWLLNCITPIGWLERMVQYKDKATKMGEGAGMGLFDYPVLMAADILLYKADLVPVGEDQRQHLELARDIVRRFHDRFCSNENEQKSKSKQQKKKLDSHVFLEPSALIVDDCSRVMSLSDGTAKMSKSAEDDYSRINLLDSPELIVKKIKRCKSDSIAGLSWDDNRPECVNLLGLYKTLTNKTKEMVQDEVQNLSWGQFKPLLADAVVQRLGPIQQRYREVVADGDHLQRILSDGAESAEEIAQKTLNEVKSAMGFSRRRVLIRK